MASSRGKEIRWETLEYEPVERSMDWYWGFGLIAVIGALGSLYAGNFLFAAIIVIGALLLGYFAVRDPAEITCRLTSDGIIAGKKMYPYSELDAFDIHDESSEAPLLILSSERWLVPHIVLPLANVEADQVRTFLDEHLPEEDLERPLSQQVMDALGL
jgi:hypothetical protein